VGVHAGYALEPAGDLEVARRQAEMIDHDRGAGRGAAARSGGQQC
jgi:hypothetical protein